MVKFEEIKWPILTILIIVAFLMLLLAVGFTIGILSDDPDGLERALIDTKGEDWVENLPSPWDPILGGIENEFIAGIVGILLSVGLMIAIFYLILYAKKRKD
jgi:hypothetical protein